ncbi:formimidoylglutamase [Algivirga pacifica]|uniref:Formimidoylglutamase n=1 Tax=Algivirga pacifica TaxID=1162670 RepID=A0ABP9DB45_9BACT
MEDAKNYKAIDPSFWEGRIDGTAWEDMRWHQVVQAIDLSQKELPILQPAERGVVLIGFMCDEGVRRNKGRTGAKNGSYDLRKASMNLPVHFDDQLKLIDGGNIECNDKDMEGAQETLGKVVAKVLKAGYKPIVLGGGHEVAYGHYLGIKEFMKEKHPDKKLGIVNFDAHFDMRELEEGVGSSGTPFLQIARDMEQEGNEFHYLVLGLQKNSNTKRLYQTAEKYGVSYVTGDKFNEGYRTKVFQEVSDFVDKVDFIYNTNCLDVFSSAYAPGVSATAFTGIVPDAFFTKTFKKLYKSQKVITSDIAELNPEYDKDRQTAKLAAALTFIMVGNA